MEYEKVFYKGVAKDGTFVGIAECNKNGKDYINKDGMWCKLEDAEYISLGSSLYHCDWLSPETIKGLYETINISEIDEDEYNQLLEIVNEGKEVENEEVVQEDISELVIPTQDEMDVATLEYVKKSKLESLSATCEECIKQGFDAQLSDGETHHFSLGLTDQINIMTLNVMIASGATEIPYHADGEVCKYYSVDDINIIIQKATELKEYHTTYFNSLKQYVQSLETIADAKSVTYGMDIPEEYQSDILKGMIQGESE